MQEITTKEAIKILHDTQKYRRGNNHQSPPHTSKKFGEAIDYAIRKLREISKQEQNDKL